MRIAGSSRERLLAAATLEFAARGFDGAKVERITARARVNKAMLYYHFDDKAALYRDIVRGLFESVAARAAEALTAGATAEARLHRFIMVIAEETAARPHFPSIWLREMAEGGRHLDTSVIRALGNIIRILAAILGEGQRAGTFRTVHPVVVQMSIVAPLLLFAASEPSRKRFSPLVEGAAAVPRDALVKYLETATLAALTHRPLSPTGDL
jgi:AcrR family transcriptional regulator